MIAVANPYGNPAWRDDDVVATAGAHRNTAAYYRQRQIWVISLKNAAMTMLNKWLTAHGPAEYQGEQVAWEAPRGVDRDRRYIVRPRRQG